MPQLPAGHLSILVSSFLTAWSSSQSQRATVREKKANATSQRWKYTNCVPPAFLLCHGRHHWSITELRLAHLCAMADITDRSQSWGLLTSVPWQASPVGHRAGACSLPLFLALSLPIPSLPRLNTASQHFSSQGCLHPGCQGTTAQKRPTR